MVNRRRRLPALAPMDKVRTVLGARKKARGGEGPQKQTTVLTTKHELLRVSTDVTAADVSIPPGFREKR